MQALKQNYFSLFGLEVNILQEMTLIKQRYYQLQKQFHPDNFTNSAPQEKALAERVAAYLNDAYQTLKDPLKRAIYLLKLKGVELREEDTQMDPDFLTAQFELREKMEIDANKEAGLEEIKAALAQRQQQLTIFLQEEALEKARLCVRELQFYVKLLEEFDNGIT